MESSEFVKKFKSWYLWKNFLAMAAVVIALCLGVKFGLDVYTHHGQSIPIPNVKHKLFSDAERILDDAGLQIVVSDTGYVKNLPPDCILEQTPGPGERVKEGHVIYVDNQERLDITVTNSNKLGNIIAGDYALLNNPTSFTWNQLLLTNFNMA